MRRRRWILGGWILIPVLFALLTLAPVVRRAELWSIDQRFQLRSAPAMQDRVVIVALDDRTEQAWTEPTAFWGGHLAGLIDKCVAGGARSIGIDLLLQIDSDSYLESLGVTSHLPNLALENALFTAEGKVVLARTHAAVPLKSLVEATSGKLGLADLPQSDDGVRRTVPGVVRLGSGTYHGFAEAVSENAGYKLRDSDLWWVDFRGTAPPTYSAVDVLSGRVPSSVFRDRIVMIGTTFKGNGDVVVTPTDQLMPGVEFQARAAETLVHGRKVDVVSSAAYPAFALAISSLAVGLSRRMRWGTGAMSILLLLALYTLVCYGLANQGLFLPLVPVWIATIGSLLLAYSLRTAEELLLRARAEATFGAFVSDKVRDVVLAHEGPIGSAPAIEIEGTCLFLDIRGFVEISSKLSAQELVGTLDRFFEGALAAVQARDGLVSVFTGDGFLAVFGTPIPDPRHAECAWQAAQAILASLEEFNTARTGSPWRIGIGIHSGVLRSGYVGAAGRFTYTVMGDAVNLSARIQDSTKEVGRPIGISAEAWAMLETPPEDFQWAEVPIKGKESRVPIYYVYGASL